ncbi:MAG: hypothetical protein ACRCZF_03960 [Gemmataceae bacterium]
MTSFFTAGTLCLMLMNPAAPPAAAAKPSDPLPAMLAALQKPIEINADFDTIPLRDILRSVEKSHGIPFLVDERAFAEDGTAAILEVKLAVRQSLPRLRLQVLLELIQTQLSAQFLVKKDHFYLTTQSTVTRSLEQYGDGINYSNVKLVSIAVQEKPVSTALADLADLYDLSIVISPQAGERAKTAITARLLNVPVETAIETLAQQADLTVHRQGNVWIVNTNGGIAAFLGAQKKRMLTKVQMMELAEGRLPTTPTVSRSKPVATPGK